MMEAVFRLAAMGIIVTTLVLLLKRTTPELSMLLALAACGLILVLLAGRAEEAIRFFRGLLACGGVSEELMLPLVKTVAIALVCRTGGDLCRDAGESSVGNLLETAGVGGAILVSLPLFQSAWEMLQDL